MLGLGGGGWCIQSNRSTRGRVYKGTDIVGGGLNKGTDIVGGSVYKITEIVGGGGTDIADHR